MVCRTTYSYKIVGSVEWMKRAACRGVSVDIFVADDKLHQDEARLICGRCLVLQECRTFALANRWTHGIWGGIGDKTRQKMRRAS